MKRELGKSLLVLQLWMFFHSWLFDKIELNITFKKTFKAFDIMNKIGMTIILFLLNISIFAQDKNCDINTRFAQNAQFFFNSFQEGTVIFNNESKVNALLNYNIITNDIYYIEEDKYFSLNKENVKYVLICDYRFYFHENKVLELIYDKNVKLFLARHVFTEDLYDKKGAYGASSPNTVGTDLQYIQIKSKLQGSLTVNLHKENDKELDISDSYKILKDDNLYPATKKTLYKIYKDKKEGLKQYLKNNKLNFKEKDNLIEILNYCQTL